MATIRVKTGEVLELPFSEGMKFLLDHRDQVAPLDPGRPKQKRREVQIQEELEKYRIDFRVDPFEGEELQHDSLNNHAEVCS